MANAVSIQNGIQGVLSGVRNNALQTTTQGASGTSFQNVLSSVAQGARKTAALPKGAAQYEAIFDEASRTYGVSKSLLLAVAKQESNFNANSVSHAGAQGIMQLMPGTAKTLGVKNAFDPYENIMGGAKLLRDNIKSFGSVPLALAAYNAGPGAVKKYGGVPPYKETQDYVKKIMADLGDSANRVQSHFTYKGESTSSSGSSAQAATTALGLNSGDFGISANSSLLSILGGAGGNSLLLSGLMQSLLTGGIAKGQAREAAAGDGDPSTVTIDKQSFQSLLSLLQMQMMMPSRIGEIGE